jgi:hypothetical protein
MAKFKSGDEVMIRVGGRKGQRAEFRMYHSEYPSVCFVKPADDDNDRLPYVESDLDYYLVFKTRAAEGAIVKEYFCRYCGASQLEFSLEASVKMKDLEWDEDWGYNFYDSDMYEIKLSCSCGKVFREETYELQDGSIILFNPEFCEEAVDVCGVDSMEQ